MSDEHRQVPTGEDERMKDGRTEKRATAPEEQHRPSADKRSEQATVQSAAPEQEPRAGRCRGTFRVAPPHAPILPRCQCCLSRRLRRV